MEKPGTSSLSESESMDPVRLFDWLDEYLDAVQSSLGAMDLYTLQPTSWQHVQPLVSVEWMDWFYRIVKKRREIKLPYSEIFKALPPDVCREQLLFTLEDLKSAHWPKEKRLEVADFFYQMLRVQMEPGDLFGRNGSTRPALDVAAIMKKEFQPGSQESARALGKMYNAAYNLGAALYLDYYMGNAIENYGPYPLENGKSLVVKVMRHLKPEQIWPDSKTAEVDQMRLYSVYEKVRFSTDMIACHTYYDGDPIDGLTFWRLEKNGENVGLDAVPAIAKNIAENGSRQWKKVLALSQQELIRKSIEIRCFIFKPLCDTLGLDWRPTRALLKAAEGKTLQDGWNTWKHPKSELAQKAYWRKIWDPRIDFYP